MHHFTPGAKASKRTVTDASRSALITLLALLIFSSCTTIEPIQIDTYKQFRSSETSVDSVLQATSFTNTEPKSDVGVKGKAKVQYSSTDRRERLNVDFKARPDRSFMAFSNSLGIEGIHLLIFADSVIQHNRIDDQIIRTDLTTYRGLSATGNIPFNLYDLFFPWYNQRWEVVFENKQYWQLRNENGYVVFRKKDLEAQELDLQLNSNEHIKIIFDGYDQVETVTYPRKIQATLTTTFGEMKESERLFILIRTLNKLSPDTPIEIDLPNDIPVQDL